MAAMQGYSWPCKGGAELTMVIEGSGACGFCQEAVEGARVDVRYILEVAEIAYCVRIGVTSGKKGETE